MCGWIGNCILARAPIRPNSAWKALAVIGPSRSVIKTCEDSMGPMLTRLPKDDPASIKGARSVAFALQTIKAKGAPFISRRQLRHAYCGNQSLEEHRHRHQEGGWAVVQIDRAGHGCCAQRSSSQRSLYFV